MDNQKPTDRVKSKKRLIYEGVTIVVVALLFLWIGINVGNGNYREFSSENKSLPNSLNYDQLEQEYSIIKHNFDGKLSNTQLQYGAQTGMANATGDPYTEFFTPSEANAFNDELNNSFSGIGVELGKSSKGQLIVISPISGFPAAKAGLQPNDVITSIDGVSTTGMSEETASDKIRGPINTSVTLVILRDSKQFSVKITREDINVPSVTSQVSNGIGYMQIISFANDTSNLAQKAANTFAKDHVKGVILDLRDNPGGLVNAAVNVSSLWLPRGDTIMTEKHDGQVINKYTSTGVDPLYKVPTVVLINGGSASASEITAGALEDNNAAITMGQKSFGKGSVQQIFNLAGGAELKVTIAHWYTPDGRNINKIGITPDQTIVPTTADQQNDIDVQKNAAIQYLNSH